MPEDNTVSLSNVDFIGGFEVIDLEGVSTEGLGSYDSLMVGDLQAHEILTKDIFVCNQSRHSQTIHLDGGTGNIIAGGSGTDGDLFLRNGSGENRIRLDADGANGWFGGNGEEGNLVLFSTSGDNKTTDQSTIHLNGGTGDIIAGGSGIDGDLFLRNSSGKNRIHLDGNGANGWFGGNGEEGNLVLFSTSGDNKTTAQSTIHLNGGTGDMIAGGSGTDGDLVLKHTSGKNAIRLDGNGANGWFGGNGKDGDLVLFPASGDNKTLAQSTIHLDGEKGNIYVKGDIKLENADCAEEFVIKELEKVEPGSVMVLGEEGSLCLSTQAYDKKVAGVVSGASDFKPGLILDKKPEEANRQPIALMGKVYCKVDAQYGAIEVGDLLTTSATLGHAMKATDPLKAFGSIIGKALRPLETGQSLIPILVTLQ